MEDKARTNNMPVQTGIDNCDASIRAICSRHAFRCFKMFVTFESERWRCVWRVARRSAVRMFNGGVYILGFSYNLPEDHLDCTQERPLSLSVVVSLLTYAVPNSMTYHIASVLDTATEITKQTAVHDVHVHVIWHRSPADMHSAVSLVLIFRLCNSAL
jgi:hypothetical protein